MVDAKLGKAATRHALRPDIQHPSELRELAPQLVEPQGLVRHPVDEEDAAAAVVANIVHEVRRPVYAAASH